jgi:uncharacterized protein YbaP (TraB family)
MTLKRITIALVILCTISTIASAQQIKYPSILWEIKKTKTSKPSYLFGTYHVSSKAVFKLGDSIFTALKSVDIVAKEVNVNTWQKEQNSYDEMQYAYESYTSQYKDASFNEHTLKKTNTVEKLSEFIGIVPNFVNYFLYRNNAESDGFEEEIYLDKFISSAAFKYGKEVRGLENYFESNILSIEGLRDQADLEKLEKKELPEGISYQEVSTKMYDGYLNNNLDMIDSFMTYQFESEAFYNKFLVQRNYNQADSIDYYIKTGKTIFAAVGCAHLPGKKGVIEILRSKGYILRPVKLKNSGNSTFEATKKIVVPVKLFQQTVDNVINIKAPSPFYTYYKTDVFNSYGCVDMKNDAFYYIARLVNNSAYFSTNNNLMNSIDSLLYSSIKGEIVTRKQSDFKGYKCMDVTAKVKNKDIERYRFIVTPYEVIKFQVGGKNEYANAAIIDSFFNSIEIVDTKPLNKKLSFGFKNDYNFNQWVSLGSSKLEQKQRFTYFDKENEQLNSCIKIQLPKGEKLNDSLLVQVMRESILSSEIFPKNAIDNYNNLPLSFGNINQLKLKNGKNLYLKIVSEFPYTYLLSSLSNKKPDTSFINAFQLKKYTLPNSYSYTDTAKGYNVMLPFQLGFDARWKSQMDRKKKKYDDVKSPNENDNLFYNASTYGNNTTFDALEFEDKVNMETIKMKFTKLDKELYYPNATAFWKNIVKEFPNTDNNYNDYDYSSNRISSLLRSYKVEEKETNIKNVVYDTANSHVQKVSFEIYDSITEKSSYRSYTLAGSNIYGVSFIKHNNDFTAFQSLFVNSLKALDTSKKISIYQPSFQNILKEYKSANKQKKPIILSRLNNVHFGLSNLNEVTAIYQGISKSEVDNNILRRKLVDMVAKGTYSETEWPAVSKWLLNIFNSTTELATIRSFAAEAVIQNQSISDAEFLLKNFYSTPNPYQKRFAYDMKGYLRHVYPKTDLIPKIKLILKEKDDYSFISLADSGYFNNAEKLEAFSFYKKSLEDETLNIQLSQEKTELLFKENEINETLADTEEESNFEQLLEGFRLFYSVSPNDPFFKESFNKILDSKSNEDITQLLDILLSQKETDYDLVNKIVKQLSTEPSKLYQINKTFFENKKYDKLPAIYKDKIKIAKYLLLEERQYQKLDSIIYVGAKKYPYNNTDSVYFFKYIEDRQTNANIAYIVLDNKNEFLDSKPYTDFTSDQITAVESFEKVSNKLMRRYFTLSYFTEKSYFYNNSNYNKNITSEE